jgi:hypothetical protein
MLIGVVAVVVIVSVTWLVAVEITDIVLPGVFTNPRLVTYAFVPSGEKTTFTKPKNDACVIVVLTVPVSNSILLMLEGLEASPGSL